MENNKFINKALEVSGRIAANIYLDSISKGLMGTLPILMIGSLASVHWHYYLEFFPLTHGLISFNQLG